MVIQASKMVVLLEISWWYNEIQSEHNGGDFSTNLMVVLKGVSWQYKQSHYGDRQKIEFIGDPNQLTKD